MLFSVTSIPAWAWGVALTIIGSLALVVAWFVRRHFEGFNKDLGGVSGTLYGRVGTNNQHIPGLVESVQEIANRIDLLKKASNEAHSKYDIHLSELNNGMSFSKSSSQEIKSISGRLTEWEKEMAASMTVLQKRVNEQDRRIEKVEGLLEDKVLGAVTKLERTQEKMLSDSQEFQLAVTKSLAKLDGKLDILTGAS